MDELDDAIAAAEAELRQVKAKLAALRPAGRLEELAALLGEVEADVSEAVDRARQLEGRVTTLREQELALLARLTR